MSVHLTTETVPRFAKIRSVPTSAAVTPDTVSMATASPATVRAWVQSTRHNVSLSLSLTDIDECEEVSDNCDKVRGFCTNIPGSFNCSCRDGYSGDGVNCIGITSSETFSTFKQHCKILYDMS